MSISGTNSSVVFEETLRTSSALSTSTTTSIASGSSGVLFAGAALSLVVGTGYWGFNFSRSSFSESSSLDRDRKSVLVGHS